jgi:hypothetical protein
VWGEGGARGGAEDGGGGGARGCVGGGGVAVARRWISTDGDALCQVRVRILRRGCGRQ